MVWPSPKTDCTKRRATEYAGAASSANSFASLPEGCRQRPQQRFLFEGTCYIEPTTHFFGV